MSSIKGRLLNVVVKTLMYLTVGSVTLVLLATGDWTSALFFIPAILVINGLFALISYIGTGSTGNYETGKEITIIIILIVLSALLFSS